MLQSHEPQGEYLGHFQLRGPLSRGDAAENAALLPDAGLLELHLLLRRPSRRTQRLESAAVEQHVARARVPAYLDLDGQHALRRELVAVRGSTCRADLKHRVARLETNLS